MVAQKHRFQAEVSAIGGVSVYTWAMVEWSPRKQMSLLTLNIPSGVPPGPHTVIFCDPVVTITTDVLLIFVCV
jgi:hypothetical protein